MLSPLIGLNSDCPLGGNCSQRVSWCPVHSDGSLQGFENGTVLHLLASACRPCLWTAPSSRFPPQAYCDWSPPSRCPLSPWLCWRLVADDPLGLCEDAHNLEAGRLLGRPWAAESVRLQLISNFAAKQTKETNRGGHCLSTRRTWRSIYCIYWYVNVYICIHNILRTNNAYIHTSAWIWTCTYY